MKKVKQFVLALTSVFAAEVVVWTTNILTKVKEEK